MNHNRWIGLGLVLITLGALFLRGPHLNVRPLHNDEAVNAIKIRDLWLSGSYRYDPNEHHGPTLYYATLPLIWLSGAQDFNHLSESTLRAVSILFGLGIILALGLVADALGKRATLAAGMLTAISPAMTFYSRYFIHEMPLVFFTLMLIAGVWRYGQNPHLGWAVFAGAGLGLMYATKETFILSIASMIGAWIFTKLWTQYRDRCLIRWQGAWHLKSGLLFCFTAAVVSFLFFTSFFTNLRGPIDSLETYLPWMKRAGGASPHIHPWFFYLQRLSYFHEGKGPIWSESLILILAMVGTLAAFKGGFLKESQRAFVRFLVFYSLLLTTAYSLISYKTPWCLLGFLQPMIMIAGVGAVVLIRILPRRLPQVLAGIILSLAAGQLTVQAYRASFPFASDRRNPYVYAQTVPDILRLSQTVIDLAQVHEDHTNMLVKVIAPDDDYWPLPWYLRGLRQVGYWSRLPQDPYAPVVIVGSKVQAALDDKSNRAWVMVGYYELRPKTFLEMYVKFDLWEKYVQLHPPAPDADGPSPH